MTLILAIESCLLITCHKADYLYSVLYIDFIHITLHQQFVYESISNHQNCFKVLKTSIFYTIKTKSDISYKKA